MLDVHHRMPVSFASTTSYYAAPQVPEDARRLFLAAASSMGMDDELSVPLRPSRGYASSLILAREWGLTDIEARLVAAIEESYEPTWDDETGEFTWGMGLNERHPRGQFNAFLAAAEAAGPGRWEALSGAPLEPCPQIVGVDFPTMALDRAEWIGSSLYLGLAPLYEDPKVYTTFRIVGVEPRQWDIAGIDGAMVDAKPDGVVVRVPLKKTTMTFTPSSY
ncbi:MAG: hypothetical protein ACI9TF_001479 [Paracrocinitomix sp.]